MWTHPLPQKGRSPTQFSAHVYCGCMDQDATWYGSRPPPTRHCVRCGPSYLQKKGNTHPYPIFGPCLLWPDSWMDEDAAWYGSRPRPRPHCTRRGPSSRERGTAAPSFLAHVYCGHGHPSQLLLSSCQYCSAGRLKGKFSFNLVNIFHYALSVLLAYTAS